MIAARDSALFNPRASVRFSNWLAGRRAEWRWMKLVGPVKPKHMHICANEDADPATCDCQKYQNRGLS